MSISYSDGLEVESFILSLVRSAGRVDSCENIGREFYAQWPVQYHLSSQRPNLVRHLSWSGLKVMEIGAGMGAVSRFLAEECAHLTVVEGTQARYDVLSSRLRDLSNWDGIVANFEDVKTGSDYDVVCLIGVLEYAQLYVKPVGGDSPFVTMLKHARSCLKPDGVVLLAIENRLGLKYFAGCSEDHTNQLFDGICGYKHEPTPRTFSWSELCNVLDEAGLGNIVKQYPYPDYKMPSCVIGEDMLDHHTSTAAELASVHRYEDYGYAGNTLFPCSLVLESVQEQPQLLKELSNSFLFLAGATPDSGTMHRLLGPCKDRREVAWHYARHRKDPLKTVFRETDEGLVVEKGAIYQPHAAKLRYADDVVDIEWHKPIAVPEAHGRKLMRELVRHAYYGDHSGLVSQLVDFLGWVFNRFNIEGRAEYLQGTALDSHTGNALISNAADRYILIDQEWVLAGSMKKSWFVMRNICTFDKDLITLLADRWRTNREFYEHLCSCLGIPPSFEEDITIESHFACLLGEGDELESIRIGLKERFLAEPTECGFPRTRYELESRDANSRGGYRKLIQEREQLRAEVNHMRAHHQRKIYWGPRMLDRLIIKMRQLKSR